MTRYVNTVSGQKSTNELGNVLCHEHIVCSNPVMKQNFGDKWFNTKEAIEKAVILVGQAKEECGIDTIIDGTPLDLGRDVNIISEVSKRTGVNIILSTGMYHSEERFLERKKPEKFAKFFIDECENGIQNTEIKPGILKCATGMSGFTDVNKMLIQTMSIVQKETKLPMFAHNEHSMKTPYKQFEVFENEGVNLEKVVIGHCSDSTDVDYLEDLLKNGVFLGFDRIKISAISEQAYTIYKLVERGWEDKIVVSHDYYAFIDFGDTDWESQRCISERNYTIIHNMLFSELKKLGVSDMQIRKFINSNPQKLFE